MRNVLLHTSWILVAGVVSIGWTQERVKPKGPQNFDELHAKIAQHYHSGHYGRAGQEAKELLAIIQKKHSEAILAALPAAPEGYKVRPQKKQQANAALMAGLTMAVGNIVEQTYMKEGGGGQVDVTVTADSPMLQMFQMWVTNPAMLGPDAELIKYHNDLKAVLKKEGSRHVLHVPIGSSMVEARVTGENGDFLLAMFSQAVIDGLTKTLAH